MSADNLHLCLGDESLLALVHFAVVPLALVEVEVLRLAELRGGRRVKGQLRVHRQLPLIPHD